MLNVKSTNFPEKLKKARVTAGHSQTSLAEAIGVSMAAVSNWETGVNIPRIAAVEKLNKELFQDQKPTKSAAALVIKSPTSKKASTAAPARNSKALKDIDTDDLTQELKRRGYTVTLVV